MVDDFGEELEIYTKQDWTIEHEHEWRDGRVLAYLENARQQGLLQSEEEEQYRKLKLAKLQRRKGHGDTDPLTEAEQTELHDLLYFNLNSILEEKGLEALSRSQAGELLELLRYRESFVEQLEHLGEEDRAAKAKATMWEWAERDRALVETVQERVLQLKVDEGETLSPEEEVQLQRASLAVLQRRKRVAELSEQDEKRLQALLLADKTRMDQIQESKLQSLRQHLEQIEKRAQLSAELGHAGGISGETRQELDAARREVLKLLEAKKAAGLLEKALFVFLYYSALV